MVNATAAQRRKLSSQRNSARKGRKTLIADYHNNIVLHRVMPKLIEFQGTEFVEFSNGTRLTDEQMRRLQKNRSYRRVAECLGVSHIEYNEARALAKGEDPDSASAV